MNNSDLNEKTKSKATKAELKLEQDKIVELQTHDLSYFHGFQNIFVYQPIFNILKLKKGEGTDYVTGSKSRGLFKSKLLPLHDAFLPNIKYFGCKIGIQFN